MVRLGDAPLELPAALQRASREASRSALAFHVGAAMAVLVAAAAERETNRASMRGVAAEGAVAAGHEVGVGIATEVVTEVTAEIVTAGASDAGAPPSDEVTAAAAVDRHPTTAPVIILDAGPADAPPTAMVSDVATRADARVAEPAVDDLYNLRGLDVDDEHDAGPDESFEAVESLDEEFSRLAVIEILNRAEPVPAADAAVAEPARAVRAPIGSLSQISAARRPAMSHSVAVIVARGAES